MEFLYFCTCADLSVKEPRTPVPSLACAVRESKVMLAMRAAVVVLLLSTLHGEDLGQDSLAHSASCRLPQGRGGTPAEALEAMMKESEERVRVKRLAASQDEACLRCTQEALCCGSCACFHGVCTDDGTCRCEADWFGDNCDFHVLSANSFLPPHDPNERLPRRQAQAAAFSQSAALLVESVDELQHGHAATSHCNPLHVVMEGRGFGSWVHHMVGALTHAQSRNLTLVPRYPYDYFLHDGCPARTHSEMEVEDAGCYFEPLVSGISEESLQQDSDRSIKLSHYWSTYLPPPDARATYGEAAGIFWWNVEMVNYIVSPNRRLSAMKTRYKHLLGWPAENEGRVLGVHIRHGDACADWRRGVMHHSELMPCAFCLEFETNVIPAIDLMVRAYGATHVFVATDDPGVLARISDSPDDMRSLPSGNTVRWLGGSAVRHFLQSDTNYDVAMRIGVLDRRMTAESAVLDALLLGDCHYFIGQLSGEFSRLAFELSMASKGYVAPFMSLDTYAWAPRYGLAQIPRWWQRSSPFEFEEVIALMRNVSVESVRTLIDESAAL